MGKYKAVIADIDGTITPITPNALPSENVRKTIKKVIDKGIHFSLASGRPFSKIQYLVKYLDLSSPVICDNGAAIVDNTNHSLWEAPLPHESAVQIIGITQTRGLTRVSGDTVYLDNPKIIPEGGIIRKVSVHDLEIDKADKLIKQIERQFKNLAISRAASYKGEKHVDLYFSNAEGTKQHAVLKYAQLLGISTNEIIGIGDGYNDFPLLMACGLKVAMGNAVNDLKEIADYIAPTVKEDGIVNILEKYILSDK